MDAEAQANLKGSVRLGNYLRRLRTGYGYSLRRVEERARQEGGEIDNSQLSRYEKGICYPSFDKLRVLAGVFNIPVQTFSDVVDLEVYDEFKPASGRPNDMLRDGQDALRAGEMGRAFALYERALEMLQELPASNEREIALASARLHLSHALKRLGKLSLAERELRTALRMMDLLPTNLKAQALFSLANVHADQGDLFLAELEAEKAQSYARTEGDDALTARILHTLARVLSDRRQDALAIDRYREAAEYYDRCEDHYEATRVRINIGVSFVNMGKSREGIRLLRDALNDAHAKGHRRLEAFAWSSLGEAYFRLGDPAKARVCFAESNSLASSEPEMQTETLFFNAFYEWKMATGEANPTREKIAFGRLKALRASLERRLPEVEAFDAHVERGRSDA